MFAWQNLSDELLNKNPSSQYASTLFGYVVRLSMYEPLRTNLLVLSIQRIVGATCYTCQNMPEHRVIQFIRENISTLPLQIGCRSFQFPSASHCRTGEPTKSKPSSQRKVSLLGYVVWFPITVPFNGAGRLPQSRAKAIIERPSERKLSQIVRYEVEPSTI